MLKLKERTIELIILGIMYILLLGYCYTTMLGEYMSFIDTDDFMRVVRIREFFDHFDLSNYVIARSNYPYGCELHWTRLYDFFIIGLTWFIDLFTDSLNHSIDYACFCISPILGLVSMVFIFKIFEMFMKKDSIFLATAIFCASPFLMCFFSFGRPDHHSFLVLCMLVYLFYIAKMIFAKNDDARIYIKISLAATACVWASPETLIVLLLTNAVLFFAYMNDYKKIANLYFTNLITSCCVGTIGLIPESSSHSFHTLAMCILMLLIPYTTLKQNSLKKDPFFRCWHYVCLLFMMLFLTKIQPVEYDKISIVHATLFMCLSTFFAVNLQLIGRKTHLYDAILWALVIGLIFLSMFPKFLMGMSADIPQFVKDIWLSKISELQSPLSGDMLYTFLMYTVIFATAATVKIQEIRNQKISGQNIMWIIYLALASCYWLLSCFAYRMTPYMILFGLPIIVSLCMSSKYVQKYSKPIRMIITTVMACFFVFVTALFGDESDCDNKDTAPNCKYSEAELFECVDRLSSKPVVIMAHSNHGPKLLYYTKHCVLGAPYHRQIEGIISSYKVMDMDCDMDIVRETLQKTKAQFIFIGHKQEHQFPKSFASNILAGQVPPWLSIVKIPEKFSDYSIFKVDQNLLTQDIQKSRVQSN